MCFTREKQIIFEKKSQYKLYKYFDLSEFLHRVKKNIRLFDRIFSLSFGAGVTA